jgi:septal ring factor EnvC (AmiA/AmiB activator)
MLKRAHFLGILFILLACIPARSQTQPQSRAELEKERATIQQEIEEVRHSLDENKKNKKETLGQLALLQRRLRLRQSAIVNINQQINFIQADINNSWQEIAKLKRELDTLRLQYSESVVYSYENRSNYDFLNFIFAATSFNDALKRVAYLKSYRAYREERAQNIKRTQDLYQSKIDGLKVKRVEKDEALQRQSKEKAVLELEKKEKDAVVTKLQSQEKELKKQMQAKQRQDQKLNSAIAAAIRRARDAAIKEAKKDSESKPAPDKNAANPKSNAGAESGTVTETKPKAVTVFDSRADIALSDNFEKNKGHLPWPVSAGNIVMTYGPHEYIKGITHNNPGITIESNQGNTVKAVFDGVVQNVINVGDVQAVIIRHGKYFTTYSNLEGVSVSKGENVKTGEALGKLSDIGQLEFIISDDKDRNLDPERWLRR